MSVRNLLRRIAEGKPGSVIYLPRNKQRWRLVFGVRSTQMKLQGYQRMKLVDFLDDNLKEQYVQGELLHAV